jgi:hypothetical protein
MARFLSIAKDFILKAVYEVLTFWSRLRGSHEVTVVVKLRSEVFSVKC